MQKSRACLPLVHNQSVTPPTVREPTGVGDRPTSMRPDSESGNLPCLPRAELRCGCVSFASVDLLAEGSDTLNIGVGYVV